MHKLRAFISWPAACIYGASVAAFCEFVHLPTHGDVTDPSGFADAAQVEILLPPPFTAGCIIKYERAKKDGHRTRGRLLPPPPHDDALRDFLCLRLRTSFHSRLARRRPILSNHQRPVRPSPAIGA
ncbi:unnamed protein product [Prorocentrum cordatum]|uniref:Secreted protein n=1 Tax=Prorocentrum cordatum TaxID=2364126 RepID=A0ABN9SWG1_9DINO|nr:unnamed protein product [Polarella glacialis]